MAAPQLNNRVGRLADGVKMLVLDRLAVHRQVVVPPRTVDVHHVSWAWRRAG